MIDELYDRSYQQGRIELNGAIDRLITCILQTWPRAQPAPPVEPKGAYPCDGNSSPSSCPRQ